MTLALVLLTCHWVKAKDFYKIHERYLTPAGNAIGEYWRYKTSTYPITVYPYTAQCYDGPPIAFETQSEAKTYIEHCTNHPDYSGN